MCFSLILYGAGYYIEINSLINGKNVSILYFHMQKEGRVSGQIKAGDVIGYQGDSGNLKDAIDEGTAVSHVHIKVEVDGKAVNPEPYFSTKFGTDGKGQICVVINHLNHIIMKNLFLLMLLMFGVSFSGFTQTNTYYQNKNVLSPEVFYNISCNGMTLESIIATKGDPAKVDALFGMHMKTGKSSDPNYNWINFGNGAISFTFDKLIGNLDLSSLEVLNKSVAVKIGDEVIHLGDSIDKLGSVKIYKGLNSGTKFILFLPQAADGQSLRIDFNQETRIITKITYTAT